MVDAKVRTTGVACYCTKCDTERTKMIKAYALMLEKNKGTFDGFDDIFGNIFSNNYGKGKF